MIGFSRDSYKIIKFFGLFVRISQPVSVMTVTSSIRTPNSSGI